MTADPTLPTQSVTRTERLRRWSVYALYGLAAFWGLIQVILPSSGSAYVLTAIAVASAATAWAANDAKIHERGVPSIVWLLFFLTWPLATLMYLIWTRGIPGVGYWVVNVVGLVIVMMLLFYPTFYLLYSFDMIDLNDFELLE